MDDQLRSECTGVLESLKENVGNNVEAMGKIHWLLEKLKAGDVAEVAVPKADVVKDSSNRRDVIRDSGEIEQHKAETLKLAPKAKTK